MKTPTEARAAWVEALRSGQYVQTKGRLRRNDAFCCLGVACELAIEDGVPVARTTDIYGGDTIYIYAGGGVEATTTHLPLEVREWLGLNTSGGEHSPFPGAELVHLTDMNDNGVSFKDIADRIEAEPKGLVVNADS